MTNEIPKSIRDDGTEELVMPTGEETLTPELVENVDKAHRMASAAAPYMNEALQREENARKLAEKAADFAASNNVAPMGFVKGGNWDASHGHARRPEDRYEDISRAAESQAGTAATLRASAEGAMNAEGRINEESTEGEVSAERRATIEKEEMDKIHSQRNREEAIASLQKRIADYQAQLEAAQTALASLEAAGPTRNPIKLIQRRVTSSKVSSLEESLAAASHSLSEAQEVA